MKVIARSVLFLVGLVGLGACGSPQINTSASPSPDKLATSTVEPAQNIFGQGMFTIDLPAGWDISSEEIKSDPNRPYVLYLLGEDPTTNDGPGTSRVIIANALEWTPEDFVLSQCSTCPLNPLESTTLGGVPALRTEIGGNGVPFVITWYFVEHNGKLVAFAIHDPETLLPLDEVIASIRFE
jgi:hypothetical protein